MSSKEEKRLDGSVRIHVGGLPRGTMPEDLSKLIGRVLPDDAGRMDVEIMRDQQTGLERGFGYVTMPSGAGGREGAERAISAYNGTRWRGSRIRVGVAKGDYLERLKAEWKEAELEQAQALQKAAPGKVGVVGDETEDPDRSKKTSSVLRIRRRPGEKIMLVDVRAIPWTKPPSLATANKKRPRDDTGSAADDDEEEEGGGYHRRKRGVLGCRRKVVFGGREATCSTKAKDLWRRHLKEQAANVNSARSRAVDRFLSGGTAAAANAIARVARHDHTEPHPARNESAAEHLPLEDVAADLQPEEPPMLDGVEFVWDDDDAHEDTGGGDASFSAVKDEEEYRTAVVATDSLHPDDGGDSEEDGHDDGRDTGRSDGVERAVEKTEVGEGQAAGDASMEMKVDHVERRETGAVAADATGRPEDGLGKEANRTAAGSVAASAGKTVREERRRGGNRSGVVQGVDMDERLAELMSDGSDDEGAGDDAAYDYELETAKTAQVAGRGSGSGDSGDAVELVRETMEGMAERLQSETQRSLNILAQMLGGEYTSKAPSGVDGSSRKSRTISQPPPTAVVGRRDPSRSEGGISGDTADVSRGGGGSAENISAEYGNSETASNSVPREEDGDEHDQSAACGKRGSSSTEKGVGGEGVSTGGRGSDGDSGKCSDGRQQQQHGKEKERFVAHMSTLTDIFKVEDKVSTKKNQAEKEKDKGFRMTSLFDGSLPETSAATATAAANTTAGTRPAASKNPATMGSLLSTGGTFSFSFGADDPTVASHDDASRQGDSEVTGEGVGHDAGRTVAGETLRGQGRPMEGRLGRDGNINNNDAIGLVGSSRETCTDDRDGGGDVDTGRPASAQETGGDSQEGVAAITPSVLWRPLTGVVAMAAGFVRAGSKKEIESAWIHERRALTQDFKRKHKDALKGRRSVTRGGRGSRGVGKRGGSGTGASRKTGKGGGR